MSFNVVICTIDFGPDCDRDGLECGYLSIVVDRKYLESIGTYMCQQSWRTSRNARDNNKETREHTNPSWVIGAATDASMPSIIMIVKYFTALETSPQMSLKSKTTPTPVFYCSE
jgi:hypothetical protein